VKITDKQRLDWLFGDRTNYWNWSNFQNVYYEKDSKRTPRQAIDAAIKASRRGRVNDRP
jgi:hypothetical protein